jgi:hypothetical protein
MPIFYILYREKVAFHVKNREIVKSRNFPVLTIPCIIHGIFTDENRGRRDHIYCFSDMQSPCDMQGNFWLDRGRTTPFFSSLPVIDTGLSRVRSRFICTCSCSAADGEDLITPLLSMATIM